jgi:hypothetical protein
MILAGIIGIREMVDMTDMVAIMVNVFQSVNIILNMEESKMKKLSNDIKMGRRYEKEKRHNRATII